MNIALIDYVEILPKKAFSIKETFHQMRHKVILQVYDSEEEFHHILLLYFFPFMGKLSLEGCLDLIPTILELKAEIFLSNVEHFCDLIDCDFKDTVGISTVF